MNRMIRLAAIMTATTLVLAGCSGQGVADKAGTDKVASTPESRASSTPEVEASGATGGLPRLELPVKNGADIDGLIEVNGHDLAVHCTGSGTPTVVILHGWIDQPGVTSYGYYGPLRDVLSPEFRFCSYDRANVGDSETVEGTQTPEMVVGDLNGLMGVVGDPGPYVLVGQSAGGMVASAYAVTYPQSVRGIVMVDASFDEEVTIEDVGMVPEGVGPCDPVNREADGFRSLQRIDNCAMYKYAYSRRAQRPEVPLVYLASQREPWSAMTDFGPAYTEKIVPLQKAYAASWSPGRFQWVDSGHEIHVEKPGDVRDAVRWVVEKSRK